MTVTQETNHPTQTHGDGLVKCQTGIRGLDQVTMGGLPAGRPTLICGGPGTGKTLLAMEFLVRGASTFNEPGVFISFEERETDLAANVASLGFAVADLVAKNLLIINDIVINPREIVEAGEYSLDGLLIQLGAAIDGIGAKRVVLDTIEVLFGALTNLAILRAELKRLFEWLKDKGVTAIITGERGDASLTRRGLEEYVSDCVILLDQRIVDQVATRRLRIVKYRGSLHGLNEYPFLIDEAGFFVLPLSHIKLDYQVSTSFVSTGVAAIDAMLDGGGYFRGSAVLITGGAGTGKTSIAAQFAEKACERGERCCYFAFEESPQQVIRNMRSIGVDFEHWATRDLLHFTATRPTTYGLELHISTILKAIEAYDPAVAVLDPISSFVAAGTMLDAQNMLARVVDLLKSRQITTVLTSLIHSDASQHNPIAETSVSSLIDTWIHLRNVEQNGELNRLLFIRKARGMKHSNQIREMTITDHGVTLDDIYVGPDGVLVGGARIAQQMRDIAAARAVERDIEHKSYELTRKRKVLDARVTELQAAFETEARQIEMAIEQEKVTQIAAVSGRETLGRDRERPRTQPVPGAAI
jgi:circadian clock protein KaiC